MARTAANRFVSIASPCTDHAVIGSLYPLRASGPVLRAVEQGAY